MADIYKYTDTEASNLSLGQNGCILIDDDVEHTGPYVAITALTDAVVDVDQCDMSWIDDVADFTIPKGVTIFGLFASIELDSGTVIAYKAS